MYSDKYVPCSIFVAIIHYLYRRVCFFKYNATGIEIIKYLCPHISKQQQKYNCIGILDTIETVW